jgi:hypothetical protein
LPCRGNLRHSGEVEEIGKIVGPEAVILLGKEKQPCQAYNLVDIGSCLHPQGGAMWQVYPEYRAFCTARDAWLMFEGLNDVDPFVRYPPCYSQSPFVPEVVISQTRVN